MLSALESFESTPSRLRAMAGGTGAGRIFCGITGEVVEVRKGELSARKEETACDRIEEMSCMSN